MLERRLSLRHLLFAGACIALACAEAENGDTDGPSGGLGGSGGSSSGSGGSAGVVGSGGSASKGGSAGTSGGGSTSTGGSTGSGGSAGTTSKGGSTSAGGSGGTVSTPPPLGCLPMGEGGAGGDTGSAGQGGLTGEAGATPGGAPGAAGVSAGGTAGAGGTTSGMAGASAAGAGGADSATPSLFFDDFENGAGAWMPFANWSVIADGSNVYTESDDGTPLRFSMATGTCWADQIVEARLKIVDFPGQSTGYFAAIFARVVDDQNAYFAAIDSSTDTRFTIRTLLNGSINKIGTEQRVQITRGNWYDIKFEAIGSTLTATLVDDSGTPKVVTVTNSRIASGGVGVGVKNGEAHFDDVRVTAP